MAGLVISILAATVALSMMGLTASTTAGHRTDPPNRNDSNQTKPVEVSPAQQRDAQMEEQGFSTWQSGETWLKAADPGSFTCDYGTRCLWYSLVSYSGCSAGFYVKGDILNENGVAIDWTNEITASVAAKETVAFQLRTMTDGSKFRLTEVTCML